MSVPIELKYDITVGLKIALYLVHQKYSLNETNNIVKTTSCIPICLPKWIQWMTRGRIKLTSLCIRIEHQIVGTWSYVNNAFWTSSKVATISTCLEISVTKPVTIWLCTDTFICNIDMKINNGIGLYNLYSWSMLYDNSYLFHFI